MVQHIPLPVLSALAAALCFATAAPLSKILTEHAEPVMLSGWMLLGTGIGMLLYFLISRSIHQNRNSIEAPLARADIPWLCGSIIFGSVIPAILLMVSLQYTTATTAAFLLCFEGVATTIIAISIFNEYVGYRVWTGLFCITISCLFICYDPDSTFFLSLGALGVILACVSWGIGNTIICRIAYTDPVRMIMIKGFIAGLFMVGMAILVNEQFPDLIIIVSSLVVGFIAFGGLVGLFFIYALRGLGAARTGSYFSVHPIFGVLLSFLIFQTMPDCLLLAALMLMVIGILLLITEQHSHMHYHNPLSHEHRHRHDDHHHIHEHTSGQLIIDGHGYHSHLHSHMEMKHNHPHHPDLHHQHEHEDPTE